MIRHSKIVHVPVPSHSIPRVRHVGALSTGTDLVLLAARRRDGATTASIAHEQIQPPRMHTRLSSDPPRRPLLAMGGDQSPTPRR